MVQRAPGRPFFDAESEEDSHASDHVSITKERPLSVTEITEFVNREFGPFAMEKEQLMNRSTVTRILDAMEFWTEEGNLLNFKVTQCGSENKKLFCLERPKG